MQQDDIYGVVFALPVLSGRTGMPCTVDLEKPLTAVFVSHLFAIIVVRIHNDDDLLMSRLWARTGTP